MQISKTLSSMVERFVNSPLTEDADSARRRRLLNIILGGLLVAAVFTLLLSSTMFIVSGISLAESGAQQLILSGVGLLVGASLIYLFNRIGKIPSWIVNGFFLIFMMVLLAYSDSPEELANGRSLFVFSLPVIMSSMLLQPSSSFVFALFSAIEIVVLAGQAGTAVNIAAIVGYFFLALISWLSARSLEQALKDLRVINANLDQLVEQKTQELANTLSRELI
ncbi:MAG: hypothetical protein Q8L68_05535, partial [Methylococcales bacterium]|nr:hypothetical protein [Methylococcales bacterium]